MRKQDKRIVIFLIILLSIGMYTVYTINKNKNNRIKGKEIHKEIDLEKRTVLTNMEEVFEIVEDSDRCSNMLSELIKSTQYINILLEDIPKADNVEEYYSFNKTAISSIFGITSEEEFKKFYEVIKPLQKLNKYEIIINSINETVNKYTFDVKLKGQEDIIMPILIVVNDFNNKSSSYWNMR